MGGTLSVQKEKTSHVQILPSNEMQLQITCKECVETWTLSKAEILQFIKDNSRIGYKSCYCRRSNVQMKYLRNAEKAISEGKRYRKTTKKYTLETDIQGESRVSPEGGTRTPKQTTVSSQGGIRVSPENRHWTQNQRKGLSQGGIRVSTENRNCTQKQRKGLSQGGSKVSPADGKQTQKQRNYPSQDTRTTVSQYWNRTVVNQESVHIKGIPNVGQSCYANAILQILNQTLCDYNGNTVTSCRSSSNTITEVFENFLCEMNDQNMNVFHVQRNTVQELMQLFCQRDPSFILGQQNDCHSFMLSLLNMIKDEGKRSFFPMFEAQIKTVFRYEPCGHDEHSDNETCLSFLIPIKDKMKNWTVEKGLNHLLEKEVLPHKQLFCRECFPLDSKRVKENSKTTKQMIIVSSPEFLVLHLGRFLEGEGGKIVKIQVKVGYDAVLFLPVLREKGVRYELYAVVLHNGTINGGHYTSMIRKHGDVWFDCNDFTITRINEGQAYNNPNAYLLFYRKSRT